MIVGLLLLGIARTGAAAAPAQGDPADSTPAASPASPASPTSPTPNPEAPLATPPDQEPSVQSPAPPPERKPEPPTRGYQSEGVYSRFAFGIGVHIGVKAITSTKPLLGGISAHFRASGIAGVTIEYDFNRVQDEPSSAQLLQDAQYLAFIPNLRVHAVIFPYRWRMLGPFLLLGMGFDTAAQERSTNLQFGLGLEVSFWQHRLAVVTEVRAFMPLPSDVERHRARVKIAEADTATGTGEYYNFKNLLFTLSLRFYY